MEFKTCIAEFIEEQDDDMCFYVMLSDPIRGKDKNDNIVFFEHLVLLERLVDDNTHTVVMGSYNEAYSDVCPIPVVKEMFNNKAVDEILGSLGYRVQMEYM